MLASKHRLDNKNSKLIFGLIRWTDLFQWESDHRLTQLDKFGARIQVTD